MRKKSSYCRSLTSIFLFLGLGLFVACGQGFIFSITITTFTIEPRNFFEGATLHSGFLIGKVTSKTEKKSTLKGFLGIKEAFAQPTVAVMQVSFDGAGFVAATGTTEWKIALPNITNDAIVWPTSSKHTLKIQAVGMGGEVLDEQDFMIKKGINKDFNGDGFSDILVGASLSDNPTMDRGAAFAFHGSEMGLSTTPDTVILYPAVDAGTFIPGFGGSLSSAGDVNGDGYADAIIGASNSGIVLPFQGAAFVYHGSPMGLSTMPDTSLFYPIPAEAFAIFGSSVSTVGDVNGDGYDDVGVGAFFASFFAPTEGAIFVYHGSGAGIPLAHTTAIPYAGADTAPSGFGLAIAPAGDVDADGFADAVFGAFTTLFPGKVGTAFVYHGSVGGLALIPGTTMTNPGVPTDEFSLVVNFAGDVNGDGFDDVVVTANSFDIVAPPAPDAGAVYVYHGSGGGVPILPSVTLTYPSTDDANYGLAASYAGDVNRDGIDDVIVGAPNSDLPTGSGRGAVFVYNGPLVTMDAPDATLLYPGSDNGSAFGSAINGAGEVNGDGFPDIVVTAPLSEIGNTDQGAAFIFRGSEMGIMSTMVADTEFFYDMPAETGPLFGTDVY